MTRDTRIQCVTQIVAALLANPNVNPNNNNVAQAACAILHDIEQEVGKTFQTTGDESKHSAP